jgi:hypothetical protein
MQGASWFLDLSLNTSNFLSVATWTEGRPKTNYSFLPFWKAGKQVEGFQATFKPLNVPRL